MPGKPQTLPIGAAILLVMSFIRALAAAAAFACAATGFAGPAQADQVLQGVYTYTQGDVVADWTIYPSCVPTVGDLRDNQDLPVGCRLHVAPSPATKVNGGDARLTNGAWEFSTNKKDALTCPDGVGKASIVETYRFDDVTMTGTRSVSYGDVCDGALAANILRYPFTLAYKGPVSIPVDQDPLYCEPGGLKRCW